MTTILATGPEASGNRMLARMLTEAGAVVLHKPMPMSTHSEVYAATDGLWTDFAALDWDAAVVIHRDWRCTIRGQVEAGHVRDEEHAAARTRTAIANIYSQLAHLARPWFTVTYESLRSPQAVADLCDLLGLDATAVRTKWHDANAKHYGGHPWGEHRPLWAQPVDDGSPALHRDHPDYPRIRTFAHG